MTKTRISIILFIAQLVLFIGSAKADNGKSENSIGKSSSTAFLVPVASNVSITGNLFLNETLTGNYTYSDPENDLEAGSIFKWYRSDDAVGLNKTEIASASATTYNLVNEDVGKFISFEVTPNDGNGFGLSVEGNLSGPIVKSATVSTDNALSITATSATLGGNVTDDGGATVTERGIVYSLNANPTTADNKEIIGAGTGVFSNSISDLSPNTTYFVRSYAINEVSTVYGNEISFTTLKQTLTITGNFSASNKMYDATQTASISVDNLSLVGIIGAADVGLTGVSLEFTSKTVGVGKTVSITSASLNGADATDYELSLTGAPTTTAAISAKQLSIGGSFTVSSKEYDGNTTATISQNNLSLTGIEGADNVSLNSFDLDFAQTAIGVGISVSLSNPTISGTDSGNYTISDVGSPTTTASITSKSLSIGGSFLVSSKVYDGTTSAVISSNNLTLIGVAAGENVGIQSVQAAFNLATVGANVTASITSAILNGADVANYTVSTVGAPTTTAAITAVSLTVGGSFTSKNKVYDGSTSAEIVSNSLTLNSVLAGESVGLVVSTVAFTDKAIGVGKTVELGTVSLNGADASNYELSQIGLPTTTADITAKQASISGTFIPQSKQYDGTKSATFESNNLIVNGVIPGDIVSFNTIVIEFNQAETGVGISVNVTSADLTGVDAPNYNLTLIGAPTSSANITVKSLTVSGSFTGKTKVYDGTTNADAENVNLSLNGILGADEVTLGNQTYQFDSKTVGSTKTVTLVSVELSGADAAKYSISLDGAPGSNAAITAKELTITGLFTSKNKEYDGSVNAEFESTNLSLVGSIVGDVVALSALNSVFDNENIGVAKTVSISSAALNGSDAANYTVSVSGAPTSSATITAKSLSLSGSFTAKNKVYDGNVTAEVNVANVSLSGIIGTEDVGIAEFTIEFDSESIGSGKNVSIKSVNLNGVDAGNYTVTLLGAPIATADITKKILELTGFFSVKDKTYDASKNAELDLINIALAGVQNGDIVTFDSISVSFSNILSEMDKIVRIDSVYYSGAQASNYQILNSTLPQDTASIFPAELAIQNTQANDKVYDGSTEATLLQIGDLNGFIQNETVVLANPSSSRFENKSVGTTKNVIVKGFSLSDGTNGGLAQNYVLAVDSIITTASITKKDLVITANDSILIYTGVPFSGGNGVTFNEFAINEDSTFLDGSLAFSGTSQGAIEPGTYEIIPQGFTSNDYEITYSNATLSILAVPFPENPIPDSAAIDVALTSEVSIGFSIPVNLVSNDSILIMEDTVQVTTFTSSLVNNRLVLSGFSLINDKTYTITIKSGTVQSVSDAVNNASFSWSFKTIVQKPLTPLLVSPVNSDSIVDVSPLFTWNSAERAEVYEWQVSSTDNFSNIVRSQLNLIDTSFTPLVALDPLTNYWWKVRSKNAAGESEWSEEFNFTTKAETPEIVFPDTALTNLSTSLTFKWKSVHALVRYEVALSLDSLFISSVVDSLVSDTLLQVKGLLADTSYYFKLRINDVRGLSDFTESLAFRTRPDPADAESDTITVAFEFGNSSSTDPDLKTDPKVTDYRMISMPGNDNIRLDALFGGGYDLLWRALFETGDSTDYFVEYNRRDGRFVFAPGRGFWVLSTESFSESRTLTAVTPDSNDAFGVGVHPGWNIIGNPYQSNVEWQIILDFNEVTGDLWTYNEQFLKTTTMEPFKGYYFYNDPVFDKDTLFIPYAGFSQRGLQKQVVREIPENVPTVKAFASYPDGTILDVNWVFARAEELELTINKTHPNLFFVEKGMIMKDANNSSVGKVQSEAIYDVAGTKYQLELKAVPGTVVKWRAEMKNMPTDARILLVNKVTNLNWLAEPGESIDLKITEPTSQYEVYIGNEEYLLDLKTSLLPDSFELLQNYPNPFNPTTVMRYAVAEAQNVKIEVFDVMGRKVSTLVNKQEQAGWHAVEFNASKLASGVYLYRIQAGSYSKVLKMLMVK